MSQITDEVHRIAVKFLLAEQGADLEVLIPVFHGWIRQGGVAEGLLIDVADYKHVPDGPGLMLIGHEWDRAVDEGDGRQGVLSVAKRGLTGTLTERVREVTADALRTAATLADPAWAGPAFTIATGEVEITLLDRLNAPNTPETLAAAAPVLAEALAPLGEVGTPEQVGDARRPFRVRIALPGATAPAATLAALLAPAGAPA